MADRPVIVFAPLPGRESVRPVLEFDAPQEGERVKRPVIRFGVPEEPGSSPVEEARVIDLWSLPGVRRGE